mmetsp:Transcript_106850/g.238477  ORF Transcript_106850/g.238477 Transcript_106850/m.238477 type:complete len:382 (-) Transcript_106850:9-1154(-)
MFDYDDIEDNMAAAPRGGSAASTAVAPAKPAAVPVADADAAVARLKRAAAEAAAADEARERAEAEAAAAAEEERQRAAAEAAAVAAAAAAEAEAEAARLREAEEARALVFGLAGQFVGDGAAATDQALDELVDLGAEELALEAKLQEGFQYTPLPGAPSRGKARRGAREEEGERQALVEDAFSGDLAAKAGAQKEEEEEEETEVIPWELTKDWDDRTVLFRILDKVLPMHCDQPDPTPHELGRLWESWGCAHASRIKFGAQPDAPTKFLNAREDTLPRAPVVTKLEAKPAILQGVALALTQRDDEQRTGSEAAGVQRKREAPLLLRRRGRPPSESFMWQGPHLDENGEGGNGGMGSSRRTGGFSRTAGGGAWPPPAPGLRA